MATSLKSWTGMKIVIGTAALITILSSSVGCVPGTTQVHQVPVASATQNLPTQTELEQLVKEYEITQNFTPTEVDSWLESADMQAAKNSGLYQKIKTLESKIALHGGDVSIPEYVTNNALRVEGTQEQRQRAGTYDAFTNKTFLSKTEPRVWFNSLIAADRMGGISLYESLLHERIHQYHDQGSNIDKIESFLNDSGIFFVRPNSSDQPDSEMLVMLKLKDMETVVGSSIAGSYYFDFIRDSRLSQNEADNFLKAYYDKFMASTQLSESEKLKSASKQVNSQMNGILNCLVARTSLTEAHAFFVSRDIRSVSADGSDIANTVTALINEKFSEATALEYQEKIKDTVYQIGRGYAILEQEGKTGIDADLEIGDCVRNCMIPTEDKYQQFTLFASAIDGLKGKYKAKEPTKLEINNIFSKRQKEMLKRFSDIGKSVKEFSDLTIVAKQLPGYISADKANGGLKSSLQLESYQLLAAYLSLNKDGNYTMFVKAGVKFSVGK